MKKKSHKHSHTNKELKNKKHVLCTAESDENVKHNMRHIKTHETVKSHVALVATPRKILNKRLYKKRIATKLKTLQKKRRKKVRYRNC